MAEKQKKEHWDEEVIDLTEVIEEGDPEIIKSSREAPGKSSKEPDEDFDDDLKDLFDSLDDDEDAVQDQETDDLDKEFEDLFKDHDQEDAQEVSSSEHDSEADNYINELLQESTEDSQNKQAKTGSSADPELNHLFDDEAVQEEKARKSQPDEEDLSGDETPEPLEKQEEQVPEDRSAPETELEPDAKQEVKPEPAPEPEEPILEKPVGDKQEPEPVTGPESTEEPATQAEPQTAPDPRQSPGLEPAPAQTLTRPEKDVPDGVEHLAQQMEDMQEQLHRLQEQLQTVEDEFSSRVLQTLEEKGSELGFIQDIIPKITDQALEKARGEIHEKLETFRENDLQDIFSRLNSLEEQVAGIQIPDIQALQARMEQKIDEMAPSAPEAPEEITEKDFDPGEFRQQLYHDMEKKIQELSPGITDNAVQRVREQLQQDLDSLRQNELQDLNERIKILEDQLGSLDIPDIQALRDELEKKINNALNSARSSQEQAPDLTSLKDEVVRSMESRIQELVSTWQSEKKSLAMELENALTYWGKMQEKLTELSQDIGEIKDRQKQPDPELQEKIDSLNQASVSREDLRHLASQLRYELEELVQKQVPSAAAGVIREEIMAMLQEDQEQE
ncbi:hypothetical protein [Desulfonatronospira sp.]|uniref:hypothetical protein n=1 Tax=Desulfonatronospira sp. TaxID=1962951 RepID=UPI0025C3D0C0|nr:hypothetical protein [Desulfonatronospira sp.]